MFDFLMANPPFNVNNIDKEHIKDDTACFPLGMPRADNGNYLWVQAFYSALNDKDRAVDVMVSVGSNFFYTVTLPWTLCFLEKGKHGMDREDQVLLDARYIYRQIDRAHRDFI